MIKQRVSYSCRDRKLLLVIISKNKDLSNNLFRLSSAALDGISTAHKVIK